MKIKKSLAIRLAILLPVLVISIGLLTTTAFASGVPLPIYGTVTVNGVPTGGVAVTDNYGENTVTASNGYYQLSPNVPTGSAAMVTATYYGYTASGNVTQNDQGMVELNLALTVPAPVASFSATPTSGVAPLTVHFTDTSTNSPTTWNWSFGDGNYSTQQNPTYIYSVNGTYTVTLNASNSLGSNTTTMVITVNPTIAPVASFTTSNGVTNGPVGFAVTFVDTSTNAPTSWLWNFGDGNTSTQQNPTHIYSTLGKFDVSLTASNSAGSNNMTDVGYITITPGSSQHVPLVIKGFVLFNGAPVSNASVIDSYGDSNVSDAGGNYGVDSLANNGSVTLNASYWDPVSQAFYTFGALVNSAATSSQWFVQEIISLVGPFTNMFNLQPGWNLIAIPVNNSSLHESTIVGNPNWGVDAMSRYNSTTVAYTTYYNGAASWKDGPLSYKQGYFVHEGNTGAVQFNLNGTYLQPYYDNVNNGWNMLGWTANDTISASDVLNETTLGSYSGSMISVYNNSTQKFVNYYIGDSQDPDFNLTFGEGFFLLSPNAAPATQVYIG